MTRRVVSLRRTLLLLINAVATALTLLTGLHENALVALLTGRFGLVRGRLREARISYALAQASASATGYDHLPPHALPELAHVADAFKFHRAPTRSPANVGEDRSTCLRVNSMNASMLGVYFDDVFGVGPRREQVFLWSISAPYCDVVNLTPQWVQEQCVNVEGNASACDASILTRFDQLKKDRAVHVGVPVDFGEVGVPYLKCQGRPADARFKYLTDLLVFQSFWAGGDYQVEFQTSVCWAMPVAYDAARNEGLYRAQAADQHATMAVAVPSTHWIVSLVSSVYSVVYLGFLVRGVLSIVATGRQSISYFPVSTKRAMVGWMADWVPTVALFEWLRPVGDQTKVFRFQTKSVVAANMWMNQWLYIVVSIFDACVNFRSVYMLLTMGTWMLSKQVTVENFLFVCTPLTKMAWITCLAHTLFQRTTGLVLNALQAFMRGKRAHRCIRAVRWYIDSVALLSSSKFYTIAIAIQLYIMLNIKGSPTISVRAPNPKRPLYGGYSELGSFWHCEIAIDLFVAVAIQIATAHVIASLLLLTKFRRVTHNRVLRILQQRYFFVGWDAFVAIDALGIDPFGTPMVDNEGNEVAPTHCSGGVLLRQLFSSGPSGWVRFAGEDGLKSSLRTSNRHACDPRDSESPDVDVLIYPVALAQMMGLYNRKPRHHSSIEKRTKSSLLLVVRQSTRSFRVRPLQSHTVDGTVPTNHEPVVPHRPPLRERVLHAYAESTWGSIVFVDTANHPVRSLDIQAKELSPGGTVASKIWHDEVGDRDVDQVVIVQDALLELGIDEHKSLLDGDLRLRIC